MNFKFLRQTIPVKHFKVVLRKYEIRQKNQTIHHHFTIVDAKKPGIIILLIFRWFSEILCSGTARIAFDIRTRKASNSGDGISEVWKLHFHNWRYFCNYVRIISDEILAQNIILYMPCLPGH